MSADWLRKIFELINQKLIFLRLLGFQRTEHLPALYLENKNLKKMLVIVDMVDTAPSDPCFLVFTSLCYLRPVSMNHTA